MSTWQQFKNNPYNTFDNNVSIYSGEQKSMKKLYRIKLLLLDLDEDSPSNVVFESENEWSFTNKVEDLIFENSEKIKKSITDHNSMRFLSGLDGVLLADLHKEVIVGHSWNLKPSSKDKKDKTI